MALEIASLAAVLFIIAILLILGAIIFIIVFWIWMIIDCAQRKFKNDTDKIVWILIVIFLQIIGAIIYYFVIKTKKQR